MGDDIASNNAQYVVLNAEIATQFGRQLDRVCLPSMRNTFMADSLMTAGAAALSLPTEGNPQKDILSPRHLKNAHVLNRTTSRQKLFNLDSSHHSKLGSSIHTKNIVATDDHTIAAQNTLQNAGTNPLGTSSPQPSLERRRSNASADRFSNNVSGKPSMDRRRSSARKSSLAGIPPSLTTHAHTNPPTPTFVFKKVSK